MTFAETVNRVSIHTDVPTDVVGLRRALIAQREYTLALYADLPAAYWEPRNFPVRETINPPLWELAHIGWFQEFFALRWRVDDVTGLGTPSCLDVADRLFDSRTVPHQSRWQLTYPSKAACLEYMRRVLENVIDALTGGRCEDRYGIQLVLLHEDMHAEALAMTLTTLGLTLPTVVPKRAPLPSHQLLAREIRCTGGTARLGASTRAFCFDNE